MRIHYSLSYISVTQLIYLGPGPYCSEHSLAMPAKCAHATVCARAYVVHHIGETEWFVSNAY